MSQDSKKILTRALYIGASLLFLALLIGTEFYWRFDPKLHMIIRSPFRDTAKNEKTLIVLEENSSAVDTARREFKSIHPGITTVYLFLDAGKTLPDSSKQQIIMLQLTDKYLSEVRPLHISSDSSTQLLLIPNTTQGLPAGSSKIVYLKNDSTIGLLQLSGLFISDIDKDGSEEVNVPEKGGWMKLNTETGDWVPAELKPRKTTP